METKQIHTWRYEWSLDRWQFSFLNLSIWEWETLTIPASSGLVKKAALPNQGLLSDQISLQFSSIGNFSRGFQVFDVVTIVLTFFLCSSCFSCVFFWFLNIFFAFLLFVHCLHSCKMLPELKYYSSNGFSKNGFKNSIRRYCMVNILRKHQYTNNDIPSNSVFRSPQPRSFLSNIKKNCFKKKKTQSKYRISLYTENTMQLTRL